MAQANWYSSQPSTLYPLQKPTLFVQKGSVLIGRALRGPSKHVLGSTGPRQTCAGLNWAQEPRGQGPPPPESGGGLEGPPFASQTPKLETKRAPPKLPTPLIYTYVNTPAASSQRLRTPLPLPECSSPAQCSSPGECDPSSLMRSLQLNAALLLNAPAHRNLIESLLGWPARAKVTLTHLRQAPAFEYSLFLLRDSLRDGWRLEARNLGTLEA